MSSDRKKERSRKEKRKKYFSTDPESSTVDDEDSYFSSSFASSSDESEGEYDSKRFKKSFGEKKKKSLSSTPSEKYNLRKSKERKKRYSDDYQYDRSIYRSNGKLSLQTISSLNNSRTILSALQSLQKKIKRLEEERDRYKNQIDSVIQGRNDDDHKLKEERLLFLKDKEEIMKERNKISEELVRSQEKVSQLETQLSQFEDHTSSLREDLRDLQVKIRDREDRNMELSRKIIELEQSVDHGKQREDQQSRKIEELSRFVVKERRAIERLEEQNNRLNASVQNLVGISKKKRPTKNGSNNDNNYNTQKKGKKRKFITKKRKKKKKPVGGIFKTSNPVLFQAPGWTEKLINPPSTIKKKKKKKKKLPPKRGVGGITTTTTTSNKNRKKGSDRWKPGKGTLKERLFRANLHRPVPFVSGGSAKASFNSNSLAQTGLNMGVSNKKLINSIEKSDSSINIGKNGKFSGPPSTISTNPSSGLADPTATTDFGMDHTESVMEDIRKEYDSLASEYQDLLGKVKTGEEVRVTAKLKVVNDLMKRKERQLEKLRNVHRSMVHSSSLLNKPRIRGAEKRVKTLKLFRNLKKIVNT